jgi:hypothetical protein
MQVKQVAALVATPLPPAQSLDDLGDYLWTT